ncbi:MAG: hypothetical protein ABL933_05115 [Methyloglobulus sp.]|nr:cellulase family glycosylhydrolase [Methyloglobulus sp.]
MKNCLKVFGALFVMLLVTNANAFDKIMLNHKSVLFTAFEQTVPLVKTGYVGWNANWKWAGEKVTPTFLGTVNDVTGNFVGKVAKLGISFTGSVTQPVVPQEMVWTYDWSLAQNHPNAIGFGIEFDFKLKTPVFPLPATPPIILPDNEGWRWNTPDGQSITVKFKPALASVNFSSKGLDKVRALFFTKINPGIKQTIMTVTVDPQQVLSGPTYMRYKGVNADAWDRNILSDTASPIDLSFLNADELPAGKHGFLSAKGDKLVFKSPGNPDIPAKFWGTNLLAYALFSTQNDDIRVHAKRIAQLGYNLVRIHHHDSKWVHPSIFKHVNDTLVLSEKSLQKLDLWIKALKNHGVYVWLDLHVGRTFTVHDGIDNFKDASKNKKSAELKGFNYYNTSIQDKMMKFNEDYLNHVNPYTGLAYKNDPAIVSVLMTNENDLTRHFGNALLKRGGALQHHAIFKKDAVQFAKTHRLPVSETLATWTYGAAKIYLNDVEHRFNQKMISHLENIGVQVPIVTTSSWGYMGLYGLPSLTDGGIIDAHSYGHAEEFSYNPRYNPGFLSWVAAAQVSGKPLSVTEWNMGPFPVIDRYTAPIFTASVANLQGWDAMMGYGYNFKSLSVPDTTGDNYSTYNDPAMIGLMPAAALLYRQNHVSQAKQAYELTLPAKDFFNDNDPTNSKTIRTLLETSKLSIAMPGTRELPWLQNNTQPDGVISVFDANRDFIPPDQNYVESDTHELKRDWVEGIQTINTKKSQIASGYIGGKPIGLDNVSFNIVTTSAVVAVQSLEDKPIADSTKIFITAMARSQPIDSANSLPFLSEPIEGIIIVKAPKNLTLYRVDRDGAKIETVAAALYDELAGSYTIDLSAAKGHWLILQ